MSDEPHSPKPTLFESDVPGSKYGKGKAKLKSWVENRIAILGVEDIVEARQKGRHLAQKLGFSLTQSTLIATAISELARNIVLYAKQGEISLFQIENDTELGIVIIADDHGPGIANVQHAMMSGYSTSGGLGLGLPGVRQMVDEFEIQSLPGQGTRVTITMWV